jgi:hypothetical protein
MEALNRPQQQQVPQQQVQQQVPQPNLKTQALERLHNTLNAKLKCICPVCGWRKCAVGSNVCYYDRQKHETAPIK